MTFNLQTGKIGFHTLGDSQFWTPREEDLLDFAEDVDWWASDKGQHAAETMSLSLLLSAAFAGNDVRP